MFATLWYAGVVVASLGYNGMTQSDCDQLGATMIEDILITYDDPERAKKMKEWPDPDKWDVTCEEKDLFEGEK